jgi:hypothetical protein
MQAGKEQKGDALPLCLHSVTVNGGAFPLLNAILCVAPAGTGGVASCRSTREIIPTLHYDIGKAQVIM